jgi:hypothetical protein
MVEAAVATGHVRPEIQVFSRMDIGHKDFLGQQFVNCRPFRSHHEHVRMDFVFFVPPPPFFEGIRAAVPNSTLRWIIAGMGVWCSSSVSG